MKTTNRPLWTQACFIHSEKSVHGSDSTVHVLDNADDAYLRKVAAAGGFPAYEKAHRQALDALAAKAFVRLPTEVAAHVVPFAFHVGYY